MITITIYGLDGYSIAHFAKENTDNIASLFETKPEEILFIYPNAELLHRGVEQTSWNAIVSVKAPEKYEPLEKTIADYFLKTIVLYAINVNVEFTYFHSHHTYEFVNKEYPRFIKEENLVNVHTHDHDHDDEDEEEVEIFDGNIFEEFKKSN